MKTYLVTLYLLCSCLLISSSIQAQYIDFAIPENAEYTKPAKINELLAEYKPIYDFKPGEKIASIGAGQGVREIVFSLMADSLTFYLQDLNPVWLNPDKLEVMIQYVYKQAGQSTHTALFIPVRGKKRETRLPMAFFDKIIIENSLHEFDFQADVLQQIRANLKPNGKLFIVEALSNKENKQHQGCKMPMLTDASLQKLLAGNRFQFISRTGIGLKRWNDWVYEFRPVTEAAPQTP